MPTKCQDCGEYHYAIYLTIKYKKLCPECYRKIYGNKKKVDPSMDDELAKYPMRDRI